MRRRPRPFSLSSSTDDGAILIIIVGLVCLQFSAFVALPAMFLTAKLLDSNINLLYLILLSFPIMASVACFIIIPVWTICGFVAIVAILYFFARWLKWLPESSPFRKKFSQIRRIAICTTVVCYIGFLAILFLQDMMSAIVCSSLILLFVLFGILSFVVFLMLEPDIKQA